MSTGFDDFPKPRKSGQTTKKCSARIGATRDQVACVRGCPCNSSTGGPLPPVRTRRHAPLTVTNCSRKPANIHDLRVDVPPPTPRVQPDRANASTDRARHQLPGNPRSHLGRGVAIFSSGRCRRPSRISLTAVATERAAFATSSCMSWSSSSI